MACRQRNRYELSLEKKISLIKDSELQPKPTQQWLAEKPMLLSKNVKPDKPL